MKNGLNKAAYKFSHLLFTLLLIATNINCIYIELFFQLLWGVELAQISLVDSQLSN